MAMFSGSMEPAFQRGDILFLWLGSSSFRVGEIVVFKIEGRDIPIVHRVIKVHEKCVRARARYQRPPRPRREPGVPHRAQPSWPDPS